MIGPDPGALSPELISGRIYAGPGAASLAAAGTAWRALAGELTAAAAAVAAAVDELVDQGWSGPSAQAMFAAARPYIDWLGDTAALAEQSGTRAAAAAAAFEQAHAEVVAPPVIAANRALLVKLSAQNLLGQHSAAIAALEAQYLLMWAQDVLAMHGYAARSAAAAGLPTPAAAPAVAGPALVPAAVSAQAAGVLASIPQALHALAGSVGMAAPLAISSGVAQATPPVTLAQLASYLGLVPRTIVPFNDVIKTILYGFVQYSRNLNTDLDIAAATGGRYGFESGTLAPPPPVSPVAAAAPVTAEAGGAGTVGRLTVPPGWAAAAPQVALTAASAPVVPAAGVPAAALPAGVFADLGLAGLAGRPIAGAAPRSRPAAIMNGHSPGRLERMVTELAGTHEVQHWHVDSSRLDALLEELSEQPGVYAVHVNPDGLNGKETPGRS